MPQINVQSQPPDVSLRVFSGDIINVVPKTAHKFLRQQINEMQLRNVLRCQFRRIVPANITEPIHSIDVGKIYNYILHGLITDADSMG